MYIIWKLVGVSVAPDHNLQVRLWLYFIKNYKNQMIYHHMIFGLSPYDGLMQYNANVLSNVEACE